MLEHYSYTTRDYTSKCLICVTVIMLQICVDHALSFMYLCKKKCTKEGAWSLYICYYYYKFSTRIIIIRKTQVNLSTELQYQKTNGSSQNMIATSQSHISTVYHQNCLPRRQLYVQLKLPIHYFHYSYIQLLTQLVSQLAILLYEDSTL